MNIEVHSISFKATVEGKEIERTFTPQDKGMPGIFKEVFNSIRFYLFHNPNPPKNLEPERPAFLRKIMD